MVDADFGKKIQVMLTQNEITVNNNIAIESIEKINDQLIVKGTNNYEMATDMVLWQLAVYRIRRLGNPSE
jgi:hypothetical protein